MGLSQRYFECLLALAFGYFKAEFINSINPFDKRQKKVSEFGKTMGTTNVSNRLEHLYLLRFV
tara:strand:- start:180 stop:368 length:189 start_codon:yes stop_codon:yes gene_type:complete